MLKPFITITAITLSSYVHATIDVSIPKENCLKAVEIVKNKDVELMKSIYIPLDVPDSDLKKAINKVHDWVYLKSYSGVNNFIVHDVRVFENAKQSDNYVVKSSAQRRGHDVEVWVRYSFETIDRTTNAEATRGGHCKFALLDNKWYMINLLK
ncbi:MAG: hypothetical protein VX100_20295 [Pseudomonadota bacterium]|nr:hypothetical protein [Pseudomonadota bacterium]